MKLSWHSLRVSVAGARLSHLVQKDKVWDHGTMVEQVKNLFYKIEKAKTRNDPHFIRTNLTPKAYLELDLIIQTQTEKPVFKNAALTEVSVIEVKEGKNNHPDRFTALIKGKRKVGDGGSGLVNFSERWRFAREGDWWLLDDIK